MFAVHEFEFFEAEGWILAIPFGLEGGTQGTDPEDAARMAVDWLRGDAERAAMTGVPLPVPTFGNTPKHGGRVGVVAVEASLDTIDAVSAGEAAQMLGVSRGRISQMLATGQLEGFHRGRASFVTRDSVEARLAEAPRAGRPRVEVVAAR